jgi:hypothetical protein
MKGILFAAALAAMAAVPSVASAADTMMSSTATAPYVCREAKSGDTSNATMGSTGLVCRKVDMAKVQAAMDKMHAAMTKMQSGSMTADQKAAASDFNSAMANWTTLYGFGGG